MEYRPIMSGQRSSPSAMVMRGVLRLASIPYGIAVRFRNRQYDRGVKEIHRCGVPVISVGNLTTGGTGKTPIVCFLATWFRERGIRVAIVSRGYGRGDEDSNDEAKELHARLPDVPHVQDPDRVEAARVAVEELDSQVILMDDGLQHRRLHRDLNLVVIDATCPFGYGYVLPRGLLREPMLGLRRADVVVISRCHSVQESDLAQIEATIEATQPSIPIVRSHHQPAQFLEYPDTKVPLDTIDGELVGVLSAIGNPEAFEQTVRDCGGEVVDPTRLPDHDAYSPETVKGLQQWAQRLDERARHVICTHKDLVKLQADRLGGRRLLALQIELRVAAGNDLLNEKLEQIAALAAEERNEWDA